MASQPPPTQDARGVTGPDMVDSGWFRTPKGTGRRPGRVTAAADVRASRRCVAIHSQSETVRTSLHGSWDRTATALRIHRNTVRQRIARCAALLDADLDDMDVRTELWFALRVR
ncbi:PucR C-terminal helix-turn-helix domain-containing protein [Streptomyces sp. DvalAA-43]|jgi:hypothetical protein|nr:PucR C-terminal helix-turn-helix domain-containing protein [Streptomyces sp. DvalAA-43]